jgi:hypothetical protein
MLLTPEVSVRTTNPTNTITNHTHVALREKAGRMVRRKVSTDASIGAVLLFVFDPIAPWDYAMQHSYAKRKEEIMDPREIAKMKRRVKTLQKQLGQLGPVMRGSVVFIGTRNKQYYFSLNKDKKTRLIYLGKKREPRAREYAENYQKMLAIAEEMTMLNMLLLKENGDR